jgi:hypothetical protein
MSRDRRATCSCDSPTATAARPCARRWPRRSSSYRRASALHHLGSGPRDERARRRHRRHGCPDLLLRSEESLATGIQREHQRSVAPVLPQGHRALGLLPGTTQRRRSRAQRTSSTDPQRYVTISSVRRRCCVDWLISQVIPAGFVASVGAANDVASTRQRLAVGGLATKEALRWRDAAGNA